MADSVISKANNDVVLRAQMLRKSSGESLNGRYFKCIGPWLDEMMEISSFGGYDARYT